MNFPAGSMHFRCVQVNFLRFLFLWNFFFHPRAMILLLVASRRNSKPCRNCLHLLLWLPWLAATIKIKTSEKKFHNISSMTKHRNNAIICRPCVIGFFFISSHLHPWTDKATKTSLTRARNSLKLKAKKKTRRATVVYGRWLTDKRQNAVFQFYGRLPFWCPLVFVIPSTTGILWEKINERKRDKLVVSWVDWGGNGRGRVAFTVRWRNDSIE